jgi:hypothetical protein
MIRINLLAEEQAAEEARRRDPVKRAIWGASAALALMVLWSVTLQAKVARSNSTLQQTEAQWTILQKVDGMIRTNLVRTGEIERKMAALAKLSTNRFLWSGAVNALQFCLIDNIEVTELSPRQLCVTNAAKINPDTKAIITPAASTETISLTIRGIDYAPAGEGNHTKFMRTIGSQPYFGERLSKTNQFVQVSRNPRSAGDSPESHKGAEFSFTCQFLPKVR